MVKVFQGHQYIRIILKNGNKIRVSEEIQCTDFYDDLFRRILDQNEVKVQSTGLVSYEMVRNKKGGLKVVAVMMGEVGEQCQLKDVAWSQDPAMVAKYSKLVNKELVSLNIFACEGTKINLFKQ